VNGLIYVLNVIVIKVYTMNKELRDRIKQWNEIKYGTDNGDRIVVCTLKPKGTVTTAPNIKE